MAEGGEPDIDEELSELETRLERLRSLYEQYFLGIEKIEPGVARKDVDRRIWMLRRAKFRNTAKRFKLQTIVMRYNTFQQYWARICREIENGTYRRHMLKAEKLGGGEPLTIAARKRLGMFAKGKEAEDTRERAKRAADDASQDLAAMLDANVDPLEEAKRAVDDALGMITDRAQSTRPAAEASTSRSRARAPSGAPLPRAQDLGRLDLDLDLDGLGRDDDPTPVSRRPPPARRAQGGGAPPGAMPPPRHARALSAPIGGAPGPRPAAGAPGARPGLPPARPPTESPGAPGRPAAPRRPAPPGPARPPLTGARPAPGARPGAPAPPGARPAARPAPPPGPRPPGAAPARPAPAAARPAPPARPAPAQSGTSDQRVRELHQRLVDAKRQTNDKKAVSVDGLAKTLRATEDRLRKQHGNRNIDFDVVIKDGKAVVKPIIR